MENEFRPLQSVDNPMIIIKHSRQLVNCRNKQREMIEINPKGNARRPQMHLLNNIFIVFYAAIAPI